MSHSVLTITTHSDLAHQGFEPLPAHAYKTCTWTPKYLSESSLWLQNNTNNDSTTANNNNKNDNNTYGNNDNNSSKTLHPLQQPLDSRPGPTGGRRLSPLSPGLRLVGPGRLSPRSLKSVWYGASYSRRCDGYHVSIQNASFQACSAEGLPF